MSENIKPTETEAVEAPFRIPVSELPEDSSPVTLIHSKPYTIIYAMMAIGVAMIISRHLFWLGLFTAVISLLALVLYKDRIQFALHSSYLVIFDKDPAFCRMIPYDRIAMWQISSSNQSGDTLHVITDDDQIIAESILSGGRLYKALYKIIPNKEKRKLDEIRMAEQDKQRKLDKQKYKELKKQKKDNRS